MTTLRDLRRSAREYFTPEMAKLDFSLMPKSFGYMRPVGDIWHLVVPSIGRYSAAMKLIVTAWVPELELQPFDMRELGKEFGYVTGGSLTDQGPRITAPYLEWPVGTEQERSGSLRVAFAAFRRLGLPWLDRIRDRPTLVRYIFPFCSTDRAGNSTADKVFGRNLLYRDKAAEIFVAAMASRGVRVRRRSK